MTGLLLDTHVVIWWLTDDATLPDDVKGRLDDDPDVWISPATIWEVAIKQSIGKIVEPDDLSEEIAHSGFRPLPITFHLRARDLGRAPAARPSRPIRSDACRPGPVRGVDAGHP